MRLSLFSDMTVQQPVRGNGIEALTEKEKATLRLMVRGHDAKSLARHFGLSVHTINERLRDARRKLDVSSSREAARRLMETEDSVPENLGHALFGDEAECATHHQASSRPPMLARGKVAGLMTGACLMIALLVFAALSAAAPDTGTAAAPSTTNAALSEPGTVALRFLELSDAARWSEAYAQTSKSFRAANTVDQWAKAAQSVRTPMGALQKRAFLSQDEIPTPPAGSMVIKFRSDYANKPGAIETFNLVKENGIWKVVGIYVD